MSLRIGPIEIPVPVVLAPMAGITDVAFRRLVHGTGALLVAEMVTARGLVEDDRRTWSLVDLPRDLGPRSLQLYGSDPVMLGAAVARLVEEDLVDHVDLNLGCPVPKIMRDGGGAALPVKRRVLRSVLEAAVTAAGDVPVTVKMRMGLDDDRLTHLDTAALAVETGCAAVALHARTVEQGYAGTARWDAIRDVVGLVDGAVPVLGNGDVWVADDAVAMVGRTGCDGVVVGRGCLGRPWLFADLARVFEGRPALGPPAFGPLADAARRHLALLLAGAPDGQSPPAVVRRFRKHLRWYLQGYEGVTGDLHHRAGRVEGLADVEVVLEAVPRDARVRAEDVASPRGKQGSGRVTLPHGWWADRDDHVVVPEPVGLLSGG